MLRHIFLVFTWSGTNLDISWFFITVSILIFKDLQISYCQPFYVHETKKVKMPWIGWNLRQYFLYIPINRMF